MPRAARLTTRASRSPSPAASFPPAASQAITDANGEACVENLLDDSYLVAETVPAGYHVESSNPQSASVTQEATCAAGPKPLVEFVNIPLTNLTVSVDSQIDGGTASTIECSPPEPPETASTARTATVS